MKVLLSSAIGVFLLSMAGFSSAVSVEAYIEGTDFMVLDEPVRTSDSSKIEVAEAFSYPCHACFSFEPALESWVKSQPKDVNFIRSHVAFRAEWVPYQRGYYTVMGLKLEKNIDLDIFREIHIKHNELNTAQSWADFLSQYGIEKEKVFSLYNSFGVSSQMKQADARDSGFKISSIPTLVVDRKYKFSNNLRNYEQTLKVAQFLVDKVRAEKPLRN